MTRRTSPTSNVRLARIAELQAELERLELETEDDPAELSGRRVNRLSAQRIRGLKADRPADRRLHADGRNLYLDFKDPPSRYFLVRYKRYGKAHDLGLGNWPTLTLAAARVQRDAILAKLREGIDPLDERHAAQLAAKLERARSMTFKQCTEAYIEEHEAGWKNPKHARQWPQTMAAYVYPVFGELPVSAVDTPLILKAIKPLWRTKTETASRIRGRIETVLDWAVAHEYRPAGANPARWKGHLENALPEKAKIRPVKHLAALPYAELPGFMVELEREGGLGALALRFAILTIGRTETVIGARWSEINLADRLWTIPGSRMKTGKEHRVPLSEPALAIQQILRQDPSAIFVFSDNGRRPVSNMIMLMLLRRMGRKELTVHGFRSTFSDWCAERTHFPSELREMALAHVVANKVEAAYRRGDLFEKRRQLMDAWARFATTPAPKGVVVPLALDRVAAPGGAS